MKKTLLSLIAAGGIAASAAAATISGSTSGDLIVGFYTTSGTGNGTSLMIDVGSFTQFLAGDSSTFSIGSVSVADLASTYSGGSPTNWYDRTDLSWGVIGAVKNTQTGTVSGSTNSYGTAAGKDTLFATAQNGANNAASQSLGANAIQGLYTFLNGKTSTTNSNTAFVSASSSTTSGSWAQVKDVAVNLDFKYFADNSVGVFTMPGASGTVTQDLYETVATDVSGTTGGVYKLGTLTLSSTGLSFTAIPEPSTYAAIFGVLMLGFAAYRRRFQK